MQDRFIEVSGSAFERGYGQGAAFREASHTYFDTLATLPLMPAWLPGKAAIVRASTHALGASYLRRDRALLSHRFDGDNLAFMQGIADGADMHMAQLYGVHAFESESCNIGFTMGCTSLGLAAAHCADGSPRLVYNHDFPPAFERYLFVRRSEPTGLNRSLSVSYPALIGAICGVNEHGLAVSVNQAYATDLQRRRAATFVTMLLQDCLDRCASVSDALALIAATPVTNGAMLTLVDAAGARAAVELSSSKRGVRGAQPDEVLYSFNKYRIADMESCEVPVGAVTAGLFGGYDVHGCNVTRERRFRELHVRAFDDQALQRLMADHDGGDGDHDSICRHHDPLGETILTAIVSPRDRSMKLLFGKPCQQTMQRYELLDDMAAATVADAAA
jgi:hypothetical protein